MADFPNILLSKMIKPTDTVLVPKAKTKSTMFYSGNPSILSFQQCRTYVLSAYEAHETNNVLFLKKQDNRLNKRLL
jgi:hypothetical protein